MGTLEVGLLVLSLGFFILAVGWARFGLVALLVAAPLIILGVAFAMECLIEGTKLHRGNPTKEAGVVVIVDQGIESDS